MYPEGMFHDKIIMHGVWDTCSQSDVVIITNPPPSAVSKGIKPAGVILSGHKLNLKHQLSCRRKVFSSPKALE